MADDEVTEEELSQSDVEMLNRILATMDDDNAEWTDEEWAAYERFTNEGYIELTITDED